MPPEPERARRFLLERFEHRQSVIFLSFEGAFVDPAARGRGVGSALLRAAAEYARVAGAVRLTLSTELSNATAQSLYERLGWKRDTAFCVYQLALAQT